MKRKVMVGVILLCASSLAISGCAAEVSQAQYESVVSDLNAAQERIAGLEAQILDIGSQQETEIAQLNSQIGALATERDAARTEIADMEAEVAQLNSQIGAFATERDTAQTEITSLQSEVEALRAQVEILASVTLVEEAWDKAKERHTAVMNDTPFLDELLDLAPWVEFPAKPEWFDSAVIYSATLVDEPQSYERVCIVKTPGQQMFVRLLEGNGVVSMICRGGSLDYEMTITQDENGNVVKERFTAGEAYCVISWTGEEGEELFRANVNGDVFEFLWPDDPEKFAGFYVTFVGWLQKIDTAVPLILPSDEPLVILALGELKKPLHLPIQLSTGEIVKRVVSDVCCGVPQTCLL